MTTADKKHVIDEQISVTLDTIGIAAACCVERVDLGDVRLRADLEAGRLLVRLRTTIHGMKDEMAVFSWPASWWQHVKQRWAPRWALRRWPVVMTTRAVQVYKSVCPHIGAAYPRDTKACFRYFTEVPRA